MPQLMVQHRRLGLVDSTIARLDATVQEYDEKLHIDRHPDTGDYCVYIALERPQRPYPLFSLGDRLPTPPELLDRLRASDTQRIDIRSQMNKANEAHMAAIDAKGRAEVGKAAEAAEFILRKQYMTPEHTSYRKVIK